MKKTSDASSRFISWLKKEKFTVAFLIAAAALIIFARIALTSGGADGALRPVSRDLSAESTVTEEMALFTVGEDEGIYTFSTDGKYLTCSGNEGSLLLSSKKDDRSEWRIEENEDGTFAILNDKAFIGDSPLGVSCIGGFGTYAYRKGAAAFKMTFYVTDDGSTLFPADGAPRDGDVCVIYFPGKRAVMSGEAADGASDNYAEYEKGVVLSISADTTFSDENADGAYRGEQALTVEVKTGRYKGQTIENVYNYVGPLNGVPVKEGDGVAIIISTYDDGVRATVYEYDRTPALIGVIIVFFIVTAAVGGRRGIRSLVGLVLTVLTLFLILIPLLLKGFPTLPTVFAVTALLAAVNFALLGGLHRKSVCAILGTVAGTAIALGFAAASQFFARINGMRLPDVEPLLQLRQTGTPIGLSGLLTAGIVISSVGAVMDVAMSISSSLEEVYLANPGRSAKELFKSGMNIGRDMVGTMTNTLILAFLGSAFTLVIYLYSLGLQPFQLYPSAYVATELISGVSCSVGMILSIPLSALISAVFLTRKRKA